eukprot:2078711-Amphidinium_carterae.1
MTRDHEEEVEANRRRAKAEQEAIDQAVLDAGNSSRNITAAALSQLEDDTQNHAVPKGAPTVNEGGSPKRIDEVDEYALDVPALERHAAQLASNQAADGASASASDRSTPAAAAALQRRAHLKI